MIKQKQAKPRYTNRTTFIMHEISSLRFEGISLKYIKNC